jgi:catechol 2,3-dioxygenase-like lactoylglutathione lyase family enzyme
MPEALGMELMRLHRIDHVSLDVADRPHSIAWYEDVLGARAARRSCPPEEPVFIGPAGARLGLFAERAPGLRHIALATDLRGQDGVVERLERLAVPYRRERHSDHHSVYFADPDGNTLEVLVGRP